MKFCLETCYQDRCNAFSLVVIDLGLLLPFHANYTGWGHEKQGIDQQKENAGALIITLRSIINIGQSECFIFDSISLGIIVSIRKISILIGSSRAYLSRCWRGIRWVSDYWYPITTFCNQILILHFYAMCTTIKCNLINGLLVNVPQRNIFFDFCRERWKHCCPFSSKEVSLRLNKSQCFFLIR